MRSPACWSCGLAPGWLSNIQARPGRKVSRQQQQISPYNVHHLFICGAQYVTSFFPHKRMKLSHIILTIMNGAVDELGTSCFQTPSVITPMNQKCFASPSDEGNSKYESYPGVSVIMVVGVWTSLPVFRFRLLSGNINYHIANLYEI